jgi:glycosyltransferase involved in cell wall biosynthesis
MHPLSRPKLTIDVVPLFDDQWTGIPVFTRRLVQALQRHGGLQLDFAFNRVRIPAEQVDAAIGLGTGAFMREDFERRSGTDFKVVDPAIPLLYPSTKGRGGWVAREASTVHDLSTLVMPENHQEANVAHHLDYFDEELATDDAVFCISAATRAALALAMPSVADKIRMLYQYVDWPVSFELFDRNLPPLQLGRYAAVIGTIEPRKNLALLLRALARPEVENLDLSFVVIGKKGWLVDSFLEQLTPEQRKRVIFSGFVSEFVKYRLLKAAEFLVFPSLYEGFGIPALEAMSLGKPVLASLTTSFPEVIGEAGLYFDPLSVSEFVAALGEMMNPQRLAELAPKARAQCAQFGPERMAAPVVEWAAGV